MFPKTLADWRDYVIAEVRLIYCGSPHADWAGTTRTFKGKLPSRAPYFIYEAKQGCFTKKDERSHEEVIVCAKNTTWTYTRHLTTEGLIYMLTQEFPLAAKREDVGDVGQFTFRRALNEVRRMVQQDGLMYDADGKIDEETFMSLPLFKGAVTQSCDYFRLEYMEPLRQIYDRGALGGRNQMERDQMRRLQTMAPAQLVRLYKMSRSAPWLLCLRRFSHKHFGMKPISATNVFRLARRANIQMNSRFSTGVRLLDHIRRRMYRQDGHTAFPMTWVRHSYLSADEQNLYDKPRLDDAVRWLVGNGGLIWLQEPDPQNASLELFERQGVLAFPKSQRQVHVIGEVFLDVHHKASMGTMPMPRDRGVVKIPPSLTDEQQQAMRHFWNNWLTMVVGPPGRGKTAVIESVFAEVYGICNITYVGTMVASQRERLGNRVESSHTAHSMYKTMRAHEQERRQAYLRQIQVLVWDEFSNVDEALLSNVMRCFYDDEGHSLCRIVLIFDIHQVSESLFFVCAPKGASGAFGTNVPSERRLTPSAHHAVPRT